MQKIVALILASSVMTLSAGRVLGQDTRSTPSLATAYESGRIFLLKTDAATVQRYISSFPEENRLEAIEYLRKQMAAKYHAPNAEPHTVVYVHAGNIEAGTVVKTRYHLLINYGGPPETFEYKVATKASAASPLIILNETHLMSRSGGMVDYRWFVGDKEVGRERFDVR
jgi:hypothetical protein